MKKFLLLAVVIFITSCSNDDLNPSPDKKALAQQKLDTALSNFPGLSLSVKTASENYTLVAGDAVIKEKPMTASALHYMQSISKTFTAIAVLKLKEEGKINLDAKVSAYLPNICNNLPNGNVITVRQLLNMTSGLPDYLDNNQFLNDVFAGPLPMASEQVLSYVYGQPAKFAPGASFGYCNINYHLLALIIDSVTPNGHRTYITDKIINAIGLSNTYYIAGSASTTAPQGTTANYLEADGIFNNVSELQLGTVLTFIGDDGIVASVQDIARFYYKLLHDETVLSPASLKEMKVAVSYQSTPIYGLGLQFYNTNGGLQAIGHEGSGAGAGAYAFYFPSKNTGVVLCTNAGTLIDSIKEGQLLALWEEIIGILLE
ncbi:serine hydrolase domain-containing protein [Chryseobacterium sp. 3008163]|uniref:serine hydrolase domain-containing protein n=1 Tax=Chryseobacterium sp. 3008163 TaxID=2478663 RepID=UPI000F0C9125|nr:serine hydrolase domain-containing protein [Chryseobacterium sp. 3008163]AYM99112.1 class A beta-lactamase-related serine hydrolase [Chryseobacterium sp. 3008163]